MRGLFWILVCFAVAVGLSLVAHNDGYVLVFLPPKRIEFSLTLFVLLGAVLFAVVYFAVRAAAYTLSLPEMVRDFRLSRASEKARRSLYDAMSSTYEGRYARAEKSARTAFEAGEEPVLAALVAARAAHRLQRPELRDEWLTRAQEAAATAGSVTLDHARLMTAAELLVDERRDREAMTVFAELNRSGARHIATQRLALKAMTRAGAWEEALKVARQLEEHRAVHPAVAAKTREAAYEGLFTGADEQTLRERLRRVPRAERRLAAVARPIAAALIAAGLMAEARSLLEESLDQEWSDALGTLYADCAVAAEAEAVRAQVEHAEAWRSRYPREPGLLLVLGRLCAGLQLWGKAREYLEQSITGAPSRAAYIELGRMFDATSRTDDANRCYRLAAGAA
ncbi:MAG TPA: heme biosynthesis HemY N-terminal domain-containing protein [Burkholderiales bacterium]|jgi:HemY protein|nr:heme biosynthesis HemY N-terminal domain-containing protein [Burkholderiales bacterium]